MGFFVQLTAHDVLPNPLTVSSSNLDVLRFAMTHEEEQMAVAEFTIRNPNTGILSMVGRRITVVLADPRRIIFTGLITPIPTGVMTETLTLEAVGRPLNFDDDLTAFLAPYLTAPNYHPAFVAPDQRSNAGQVLAGHGLVLAYPADGSPMVAVDPCGGAKSVSLSPLKGTVQWNIAARLVNRVQVKLAAEWIEECRHIDALSPNNTDNVLDQIRTITPEGLMDGLPANGTSLGGDWTCVFSEWRERTVYNAQGLPTSFSTRLVAPETSPDFSIDPVASTPGASAVDRAYRYDFETGILAVARWECRRRETIDFEVVSDIQAGPEAITVKDVLEIELGDLDEFRPRKAPISGAMAGTWGIRTTSARGTGWQCLGSSTEGAAIVQHALIRAAQMLRLASRAVLIDFDCPFREALEIDHDTVATITSALIPGGTATGRVVALSLEADGGRQIARVRIACCIGTDTGLGVSSAYVSDTSEISSPGALTATVVPTHAEQVAAFTAEEPVPSTEITINAGASTETDLTQSSTFAITGLVRCPAQIDIGGLL